MIHVLHLIYSLPFLLGLVVGGAGYWVYVWESCHWRNKHHPRPDGRPYRPGGLNVTYAAGAVVLAIIGYILMSAQDTHDQTVRLTQDVARCQVEFNNSLIQNSGISTQDIDLANAQSDLRVKQDVARNAFLAHLLAPPPEITGLNPADPVRYQYFMDQVREYAEWTSSLSTQIQAIVDERKKIQQDRKDHPLPKNDCGVITMR